MKKSFLTFIFVNFTFILLSQTGFVRASGKQIVCPLGTNLILRGIGTGNWMLQEGYMMQTAGVAGTEWEFRKKLTETIGLEKTNQFYNTWLDLHFRKIDVDSMSRWGFNCVRPALHYKIFTLPIEHEPVQGQHTWHENGFARLDSLIAWCAANKMYVVLDMHGAPGGQGKDANISDYDPSKPSLWESELNKQKFIALWRKIAARYANNPWVAGYDLLNETNWTFPEGNNSQLMDLYQRTTRAIREVDPNHMVIIGGNWFSNDFSGLTPPWDNNMVYTFHKYWTYNNAASIQWVIDLRNNTNRPIWLGEAGENSNRWFTDCIELMEKNNIGWAFWPVKKTGINNILRAKTNPDYTNLINYWRGTANKPSVENAFQAVMTFANNHKLENCVVQHDVIDAMIRQPHTTETKPYKAHTTASTVFAVDYDFGRAGYAYNDSLDTNYHLNTNTFTAWNNGYNYRNDGVDIDVCSDAITNGYSIGWTENGDWTQYSIHSPEAMTYNILLRYASASKTAQVYVEINGKRASKTVALVPSGSWTTWRTGAITNVMVPAGNVKLRLVFEQGGANINYFQFRNPKTHANTVFEMLSAETSKWSESIVVSVNKPIDALTGNPFTISLNGQEANVVSTAVNASDNTKIDIQISNPILSTSILKISYTTSGCMSGTQALNTFQNNDITNRTYAHKTIPGKIEAEDFTYNNEFSFETCTDIGGGINTSHAAANKHLDYYVWVENSGTYTVDFRIAVQSSSAQILILSHQNGSMVPLKNVSFTQTGGWQNWQTQSGTVQLTAGKNIIRLLSRTGGYNLNWIQFSQPTSVETPKINRFKIYPNPAHTDFFLEFNDEKTRHIALLDMLGKITKLHSTDLSTTKINIRGYRPGIYFVKIMDSNEIITKKLQIN